MGLFGKKKQSPELTFTATLPNGKTIEHKTTLDEIKKSKSTYNYEKDLAETQNRVKKQDEQLESILSADAKYKADKDIKSYIAFWEDIWNNGGLLFDGMKWAFTLPDLYIKEKRYDDALSILDRLTNPIYADKVKAYREKIAQKQSK